MFAAGMMGRTVAAVAVMDPVRRVAHGSIAGTALDFGVIEYVGVPRAKAAPAGADPGSPAVTMVVQDTDAAVNRWKEAGGTVVSTGGKAVKLPNGADNAFLCDINGLTWEFSVKGVLL